MCIRDSTKGAFGEAEAEAKFEAWKNNKQSGLAVLKAKEDEAKKPEAKARQEAEMKLNEEKAKALAEKKAAEAAAKAAAEAPAEEAPAEEAPADVYKRQLQIQRRSSRVNDGTYTHSHLRALFCRKLHNFRKHLVGKVTTVRELERTNTSIVTSLYNFLCNFCILMIKDGHHAGRTNLIQY